MPRRFEFRAGIMADAFYADYFYRQSPDVPRRLARATPRHYAYRELSRLGHAADATSRMPCRRLLMLSAGDVPRPLYAAHYARSLLSPSKKSGARRCLPLKII